MDKCRCNFPADYKMKNLIATTILCLILCASGYSQDARLVDEFGKITTEDLMARLDGLYGHLRGNEGSIALLRAYPHDEKYLGFPSRSLAKMKTYLTNHKLDEKRVVVQECDGYSDMKIGLYLVPASIAVPQCTKTLKVPKVTTLFDSYFYWDGQEELYNHLPIKGADVREAIASVQTFASLLQKSPTSRAYVIAYNGTIGWGTDSSIRSVKRPGVATKTALTAKSFLVKNGIDPNRVVAINGGYRDSNRNVELWIVPEGGTRPKPTPDYFPKSRKGAKKR